MNALQNFRVKHLFTFENLSLFSLELNFCQFDVVHNCGPRFKFKITDIARVKAHKA